MINHSVPNFFLRVAVSASISDWSRVSFSSSSLAQRSRMSRLRCRISKVRSNTVRKNHGKHPGQKIPQPGALHRRGVLDISPVQAFGEVGRHPRDAGKTL